MGLDEKTVSVPVAQSGAITLGTPVGSSDFIQSHCAKAAAESLDLCLQLTELDDPQRALLLLRPCHVPKLNRWLEQHNLVTYYSVLKFMTV